MHHCAEIADDRPMKALSLSSLMAIESLLLDWAGLTRALSPPPTLGCY